MAPSGGGTPPERDRPAAGTAPAPGAPGAARSGSAPTVLLVGADKSFHSAIARALGVHGVYVETSPLHGVVDAVVAAAPDLVLLVGDAAADGGSSVLAHLNASPHSSVVPVAILADDAALDERLRAFRHGAAAVIPRSASVDAIAERIEKLAREIPDRDGGTIGYVGEATLEELVGALSKELRSGILSIRGPKGSEDETIRVVLGGGRPIAQTIDEFVSRLRKHVVHAEPLEYEFDERAGGTVQLLGADGLEATSPLGEASGLRVLLADEDSARADAVAQALRAHHASVVVTDYDPPEQRFARLRQLDAAILLIDEAGLRTPGYKLVRRMRLDTRLRWASLLVVRWDEIWSDTDGGAKIARMLGTLSALAEPERSLTERVDRGGAFDTRLEITGPSRLMRALAASSKPVRVTVYNPRVQVRVDITDHLIAGARAQLSSESAPVEGSVALASLLVLGSGRVHVEPVAETDLVNIMSPVDVALNLADNEPSPIEPSLPAPGPDLPGDELDEPYAPVVPVRRGFPASLAIIVLGSVAIGIAIALMVVFPRERPGVAPASVVAATSTPTATQEAKAEPIARARTAASVDPAAAPPATASAPPPAPSAEEAAAPAASAAPAADSDITGETRAKAPTCEEAVGPSWSLLSSNQPSRAIYEIGLGRRALMLGRVGEAEQSFCRAAVLDPTNPEAFLSLVRVLLLRNDPDQARQWAERAAKQHPDNDDVIGLYGDALARAGDEDRARSMWLEIGKVDPSDGASVRMMSYTYARGAERSVKAADYAQADRLYRRAVLLDPLNATAAAGLSRVLLVQGQPQAALSFAKRAVSLDPRDADLHIMLGDVEERVGDSAAARVEWKSAYDIDPHNFKAATRMLRAAK